MIIWSKLTARKCLARAGLTLAIATSAKQDI